MAKKQKTDEEIRQAIHLAINKRLDSIEALIQENENLHAQRLAIKDREIDRLKRQIAKLKGVQK